jgi:hypothetical protein
MCRVSGKAATAKRRRFETLWWHHYLMDMISEFDPTDYSVVVKRRGSPPKPWRCEIYRAGKSDPVERSAVFFESMAQAARKGKMALADFLAQRAA